MRFNGYVYVNEVNIDCVIVSIIWQYDNVYIYILLKKDLQLMILLYFDKIVHQLNWKQCLVTIQKLKNKKKGKIF